ncbi:MAG: hypothetical protein A3A96_00175 [Candidatus Zambryskibacteria bacterium RIFCSPLOWO2_01_FULL_39_39]|uniref:SET domain-containing protein n=1 Tax=Candidatus Zambryskibacteria bacterium RIFCSPLOWO2_01_FULL_39_39 TaxID=1802758 RepID=A0A1G2TX80_9BACT|nr:MAG: Nuclear protein SET [Parcubacteria group bacterium GW2011_GWA1_38_7]OHA87873.1 MAG: hypothetical protein A2644_01720 [Candidatus Zambryskibacteria bacterium RIFCSPHIGHO2_01_FULL_39_63]OHA94903.1 MAG: hypothetical protein A3B88_00795 [Candidatus Zambryskibacteria bacterium RIFCSPHIGHO2_02_FULL_39_19]OHA99083.1 MAG: hypothetical protein A3F20_02745 [Candidatus Zambryskibacteria bacterium RIFCSPHIGHO2_12_FULL_39_21]OHB01844.1 MAG: hypothetical protein A3A96_00175 [Candidatus Zambryskibacte
MILVKTKLGKSIKHGIGLLADQFIPKGTITWEYHPLFDSAFTDEEINQMSEPAKKQFFHYAYFDKDLDKHVLCFDDQRFINHSAKKEDINIQSFTRKDIALKDIHLGEELLCDYDQFDNTYFDRINLDRSNLI